MGAILDIIGSYVFKAAMVGIILATSISLNDVMVEKGQVTNLEKNLNVAMSVLEWDLRNIGYNYITSAILVAQSNELQYYADVDNNGSIETVRYYLTAVSTTLAGEPVTRYELVRTVNGVGNTTVQRIVSLEFSYQDASGNATTVPSSVRGIKVNITVDSPVTVDDRILTASRDFTIFPANLSL
ncbi:MAG: hypothetical protein A2X67_15025 [Ignavibacteria bacterium GWA2_55_11]|nr:MAG: hypothetical protein A2X67_15025 [Ignavibacteria bacterium GWA2_55_11]OGU74130.1 MAG: hypothetical protein A3H45_07135 [Ignavibacteria bacterium RIFCSPLOWO2_02_FULL_55_14]